MNITGRITDFMHRIGLVMQRITLKYKIETNFQLLCQLMEEYGLFHKGNLCFPFLPSLHLESIEYTYPNGA